MSLRDFHIPYEFYNSDIAVTMAQEYNHHMSSAQLVEQSMPNQPATDEIVLPRSFLAEMLSAMYNLQIYYKQKLIPGARRAWLDDLIERVEQVL